MNIYKSNMAFEEQVRNMAEAYWSLVPGSCKPEHYIQDNGDQIEIDGVIRTRDCTVLLLATTSTKKEKIHADVKRLVKVKSLEQRKDSTQSIALWLITAQQIDAMHVTHCLRNDVRCITFNDFLRKFYDASNYLRLRDTYPFGSAEDPENRDYQSVGEYIPIPLNLIDGGKIVGRINLGDVVNRMILGECFVIEAPFGGGKSLTCREVFKRIKTKYLNQECDASPLAINLRDHWGQEYDDILIKHARYVGHNPAEEIMVGFRAGMCLPIIDGFDEVGIGGIAKIDDKNFMRQARGNSLSGVKSLISKVPPKIGMLIVGRDHYFDGKKELESSLGLSGKKFNHIKLGEFSDDDIGRLLSKNNIIGKIPEWLPRKPLFITYLLKHNLLSEAISIDDDHGFGHAWCKLVDYIAIRESSITKIAIEKDAILDVLAELALEVRCTASGTGPVTPHALVEVLTRVTGQAPTNQALASLQKLPGLTNRGQDDATRDFLDIDMLSALQGICIAKHVLNNTCPVNADKWFKGVNKKAVAAACFKLKESGADVNTVISVMHNWKKSGQYCADLFQISLGLATEIRNDIDYHHLTIQDGAFSYFSIDEIEICNINFKSTIFEKMDVELAKIKNGVSFDDCIIESITGVASEKEIPRPTFSDSTQIVEFQNMPTNSAIISASNISDERKAILTILRKIYSQAGAGRKLGALKRGVPQNLHAHIDFAMKKLERINLINIYNDIAHPIRSNSDRVKMILDMPFSSSDEAFM